MNDAAGRFRAFLTDAPHWLDLLAAVPATSVLRRDTAHPAFHGCIDWHSACHGVWSLIAYEGLTGDTRHRGIVDSILTPANIAAEAADLAARPGFEMPYGRAWFLRLAIADAGICGSDRLAMTADAVARSLVAHYEANPPDPFAREYANPSWALVNLLDYAEAAGRTDLAAFVGDCARRQFLPALDRLPPIAEEPEWPDFMAVVPMYCEILVRSGAADPARVMARAGVRLLALRPVAAPRRPHHFALNLSRAWALFALYRATGDARLLSSYLDHLEHTLVRPSWWRGDYRAVAHWVPQFAIFAIGRALHYARATAG